MTNPLAGIPGSCQDGSMPRGHSHAPQTLHLASINPNVYTNTYTKLQIQTKYKYKKSMNTYTDTNAYTNTDVNTDGSFIRITQLPKIKASPWPWL